MGQNRIYHLLTAAALCLPLLSAAQAEKIDTKKGNEQFRSGRYDEAIIEYTEAVKKNPDFATALFNTGNALQEKSRRLFEKAEETQDPGQKQLFLEEAVELSQKAASQFASVANAAKTREEKNKVNYNLGNARLFSGEIEESIEAYKEALRNDPTDDDARYNLAYARHLLQENQEPQEGGDENQERQEQPQDEGQEEQPNPQEQKEQEQDEQAQQPQDPGELTQEEAEKLLEALTRHERELQEELKKDKHKAQRVKIEKDW